LRVFLTCVYFFVATTEAINDARALSDSRLGVTVERGGYLTKRGHKVKNWKRRWFVLHPDTLEYYASPKDNKPRGVIKLDDIQTVQILEPSESEMPNSFIIYTNWDDYVCYAENDGTGALFLTVFSFASPVLIHSGLDKSQTKWRTGWMIY
jgi:hypothetical protein